MSQSLWPLKPRPQDFRLGTAAPLRYCTESDPSYQRRRGASSCRPRNDSRRLQMRQLPINIIPVLISICLVQCSHFNPWKTRLPCIMIKIYELVTVRDLEFQTCCYQMLRTVHKNIRDKKSNMNWKATTEVLWSSMNQYNCFLLCVFLPVFVHIHTDFNI